MPDDQSDESDFPLGAWSVLAACASMIVNDYMGSMRGGLVLGIVALGLGIRALATGSSPHRRYWAVLGTAISLLALLTVYIYSIGHRV